MGTRVKALPGLVLLSALLIQGCAPKAAQQSDAGQKPSELYSAITGREPERVGKLISAGANPNGEHDGTPYVWTATMMVVVTHNARRPDEADAREVLKILLENGANPNATTSKSPASAYATFKNDLSPEDRALLEKYGAK
ncbi:MAG TPA: hypothetical protein VIP46_20770 [Pyrinomonadaceae bacterium]